MMDEYNDPTANERLYNMNNDYPTPDDNVAAVTSEFFEIMNSAARQDRSWALEITCLYDRVVKTTEPDTSA